MYLHSFKLHFSHNHNVHWASIPYLTLISLCRFLILMYCYMLYALKQSNVLYKRKTLPGYSNTTKWEIYTGFPFSLSFSCSSYAIVWLCVVLLLCHPLSVLLIIFVAVYCFPSSVRMFSSGSVLVCFFSYSQRYCSADICVGLICSLFPVTNLPVFVMLMMYDLVWWMWLPLPSIIPWVHGPLI